MTAQHPRRRVVVTGIGVLAAGSLGREDFWARLSAGKSGIRRISHFDPAPFRSQIAGEVDFDPAAHGLSEDEIARADRYVQFAMVCAREALIDSGLELTDAQRSRAGVVLGSAVGGTVRLEQQYVRVSDSGTHWLVDAEAAEPFLYEALVPSSLAADVSARERLHGPAQVVSTGCTSGIDAIGHALTLIQDDEADVMVAGASESPISPVSVASFDAIKATTPSNDFPEQASRPFDLNRQGFVLAEGAAVLVLEELTAAQARGAHIYGEITGYASRSNGYHMTGLRPDGLEMSLAIDDALRQGGTPPERIGYVNAHGSGTKQNDRHETAAFKRALGEHARTIPVSSIKSMIGHSLGAIGAIEVAACALALDRGLVPPTINYTTPDPECDLDYTPNEAREVDLDAVLSVGSGFGGFQSAIVLDAAARRAA